MKNMFAKFPVKVGWSAMLLLALAMLYSVDTVDANSAASEFFRDLKSSPLPADGTGHVNGNAEDRLPESSVDAECTACCCDSCCDLMIMPVPPVVPSRKKIDDCVAVSIPFFSPLFAAEIFHPPLA